MRRVVNLRALGRVSEVADGQWGYVTVEQAAVAGLDPADLEELLRNGVAETTEPGVLRFRYGGRHPLPRLYAAWLLLDPRQPAWQRDAMVSGVLSHTSAARVYRLAGFYGPLLEVTRVPAVDWSTPADIRVHHAALTAAETHEVDGLPVTRPGRTLVDLAVAGLGDIVDLGRAALGLIDWGSTSDELADMLDRHLVATGRGGTGKEWLGTLLAAATDDNTASESAAGP
jgi:predicted transcriptional regulator of viral defense system